MSNYSGTQALILGGSCRIALALAKALMGSGIHPILTYRSDAGQARIAQYLKGAAGSYGTLFLDLTAVDHARLDPCLGAGVDYLVDFAQGDLEGLVASVDGEAACKYFKANVANRCTVIQQVTRAMVARKSGRLVYVSSAAAGRANPGQGFYVSAKSAVEALYRHVGLEMGGKGITAVTLRPGYVTAGRGKRYLEKHGEAELAKVPLGRVLSVEEVATTVMFLLSDAAVGFNATVLTMDGGLGAVK